MHLDRTRSENRSQPFIPLQRNLWEHDLQAIHRHVHGRLNRTHQAARMKFTSGVATE